MTDHGSGFVVAIVDDDESVLKSLQYLLESADYDPRLFTSGTALLDSGCLTEIDCVVSDIDMPDMDGFELCRAIKNDPALRAIPVILVTTLSHKDHLLKGLLAGADYYLTKPYNFSLLLARVKKALEKKSHSPAEDRDDLEILIDGKAHPLKTSRGQMLTLLLSTYENAEQQNHELITTQAELSRRNQELREQSRQLIISEKKLQEANAQLEALATQDGLTGLKNHRAFKLRLAEESERAAHHAAPLSLLIIDVDHFKEFNDTFGHPAGDETLKTLARILGGHTPGSGLAARYGGEEFAIILPGVDEAGALAFAEELRVAVERFPWSERPVTVSIGVASANPLACDAALLVAAADKALYRSKQGGRNRVSVSES